MKQLIDISNNIIKNLNEIIIEYNNGKSLHLEGQSKRKSMHMSAWYKIKKAHPQETISLNVSLYRPYAYPLGDKSVGEIVLEKGIDFSESDYGVSYDAIKFMLNKSFNTKDKKLPRFTIEYSDILLSLDGSNRKDHERFFWNFGWVKTDLSKQIPTTWFKKQEPLLELYVNR